VWPNDPDKPGAWEKATANGPWEKAFENAPMP
jgi:hypothetical protein